jgi:hypothetical protein
MRRAAETALAHGVVHQPGGRWHEIPGTRHQVPVAVHRSAGHVDHRQLALGQLGRDAVPGHQGHAEPYPGGLPDRAVRPDDEGRRVDVELGEQGVGGGPGPRARLPQQPGLPGQPRQHAGAVGLRGVLRGRDDHQVVRPHRVHGDVPARLRAAGQDQVNLVTVKQRMNTVPVADLEPDGRLLVETAEPSQDRGCDLLSGGRDGRDPQFTALGVGRGGGRDARFVKQPEDAPDVLGVGLAGRGEPQSAAVRSDQIDRQRPLQGGQRRRHSCLRHDQVLRCRPYRAGVRHGEERPQLVKRHLRSPER